MIGIVIVAHGGLAREYLSAVEHVVGKQNAVETVSIDAEHDRGAMQEKISMAVERVDAGRGVIVVTDLFGGSPSNLAVPCCGRDDRLIVYGANLPMLIKLSSCRTLDVSVAARMSCEAGRKYINFHDC